MRNLYCIILFLVLSLISFTNYAQPGDPDGGAKPGCVVFAVGGGGTICNGAAGVDITLSGSETGITYQLTLNGSNIGSAVTGTGNALTWTNNSTAGTYNIVNTSCSVTMSGSALVVVNPLPQAFTVGGGGPYCPGVGVSITLANSQAGISYQLMSGTALVGSPLNGANGSPLSWDNIATAGTYTIVASGVDSHDNSCTQTMTGKAVLTALASPANFTAAGTASVCPGGSTNITITGSQTTATYQLQLNGSNAGSVVAGTGAALLWPNQTTAGTYNVIATLTSTGCTKQMAGNPILTIKPLPQIFNVTGGGAYCSGATGVTIGLDGSVSGTKYQLVAGATNVGAAKNGTGAALSWTNITTTGTLTVIATLSTCTQNMSGSADVSVLAPPSLFTISSPTSGNYCNGTSGATINLSGSQTEATYQLKRGATAVGTPLAGTNGVLTWTNLTTAGTYTVVATSTAGCTQTMTGSTIVTVLPLPANFTAGGAASVCPGGSTNITLTGSQITATYQLQLNGSNVDSPVTGTGAALSWPNQTVAGTYTVIATVIVTGCTIQMPGTPTLTIKPLPQVFNVTGGGTYCSGATGVTIGLDGSASGTKYQLVAGATNVGAAKNGTGAALSWTNITTTGTLTVIATLSTCTQNMNGSVNVEVLTAPAQFTISSPTSGGYCAGTSGATINLSGSETGVTYQLKRSTTAVGTPLTGTNGVLTWTSLATAGTYTVVVTSTATGCTTTMTGSVAVSSEALPALYAVSGGGAYCSGGAGVPITLSNSQNNNLYQLKLAGVAVGMPQTGTTGTALTWTGVTQAGVYTIDAYTPKASCTRTMTGSATVVVNPVPAAAAFTGAGDFCTGFSSSLQLSSSQTGVNYQLQLNGVNTGVAKTGTNSSLQWPGITTAGIYTVVATSSAGCAQTMTGTITINQLALPSIFNLTLQSPYCSGSTGGVIALSSSENNVQYTLYYNGTALPPISGNGSALTWLQLTQVGTYTAKAVNASGCSAAMNGSVNINLIPLPPASITGPSSIDDASIILTAPSGYAYTWSLTSGEVVQQSSSPSLTVTAAGEYQVTVNSSGCTTTSAPHLVSGTFIPNFNGNISVASWRTQATYATGNSDYKGMYIYKYDEKYQVKEAQFAFPDFTTHTFVPAGNDFHETGYTYDPNGNIQTLKRYDGTGNKIHDLAYSYTSNNNQLQSVKNNGNAFRDYHYNEIGQMASQDNATGSDQIVDYDVTGKVTDVYSDVNKTVKTTHYAYDDRGFRLSKETYDNAGHLQFTTWYIRDASGNVMSIYDQQANDPNISLTETPIYGSGKLGVYRTKPNGGGEYVYELTDHLGNVRATMKNETTVYLATMEDNGATDITNPRVSEMQFFSNLFETVQRDTRMNHTPASTAVPDPGNTSYLNWTSGVSPQNIIGPGITLNVEAGDQLSLEAWAKFQHNATYTRDATPALMASLLSAAFVGANGLESSLQAAQDFTNGIPMMLAGTNTDPGTKPYAYLNYLVFDKNFVFQDGGAARVPDAAGFDAGLEITVQPQLVSFTNQITIGQSGYVYVWVSNESENTQVWWDDLKVILTGSRVTQATDYYPFGLTMREQTTATELEYRYKYQGLYAEKDDETGWEHFELREFDPIIGRWTTPDPIHQYFSPYLSMGNNPIYRVDPRGGCDKCPTFRHISRSEDVSGYMHLEFKGKFDIGAQYSYDVGPIGFDVTLISTPIVDMSVNFYYDHKANEIIWDVKGNSFLRNIVEGKVQIFYELAVDAIARAKIDGEGEISKSFDLTKVSGFQSFIDKLFPEKGWEFGLAPINVTDKGVNIGMDWSVKNVFGLQGEVNLIFPNKLLDELKRGDLIRPGEEHGSNELIAEKRD